MENEKEIKTIRTLDIYTQLCNGYIVNKAQMAEKYGVNERSIQRDIETIRLYMAETENEYIGNTVVYDRVQKYKFWIEFNAVDEVVEVLRNSSRSDKAGEIIYESFDRLWFDFPTPFTKGDIVWVPSESHNISWDCDGGFVLLGLSTWDSAEFIESSGDNTDMNGYGYFVNPNGTIYHEVMHNYMDLEFYEGPYKLNERILPALSKFVKGEIENGYVQYVEKSMIGILMLRRIY